MLTNILVGICVISTVWGQSCVDDYIIGKPSRVLFRNCDTPTGKELNFLHTLGEKNYRFVAHRGNLTLLKIIA